LKAFQNVCRNFLGNEKTENYSDIVQGLISSYSAMGYNMSLKLNFLHSHSEFFLKTWEPSPMNVVKGSIRIILRLKRCMVK
jgi:hypothetical protein